MKKKKVRIRNSGYCDLNYHIKDAVPQNNVILAELDTALSGEN